MTQTAAVSRNFLAEKFTSVKTPKRSPAVSFRSVAAGMASSASETDAKAYLDRLEKKYGAVRLESVGRDRESLDKIAKTMRGTDVVIAPNIFAKMASDAQTAAYYEEKIDSFFRETPRRQAYFAQIGLTYETCGVVVHEDGSITYICGGGDTPERQAQVAAENKAKREKQAQNLKDAILRGQEAMERLRLLLSGDGIEGRVFLRDAPAESSLWESSLREDALQGDAASSWRTGPLFFPR